MWILVIFGTIFESICEGNWIYLFFKLDIKLMYRYIYLLFVVCLSVVYTLNGQSLMTKSDNELSARIAQIDTATVKLRNNRLFPVVNQGDLNIYGYNEEDVPVFSDSAYAYRLSLLETEVPLEYNEYVKSYIDLYAFRRRKLVSKVLAQSRHYFPVFEEIFDRENIPLEMKYNPIPCAIASIILFSPADFSITKLTPPKIAIPPLIMQNAREAFPHVSTKSAICLF